MLYVALATEDVLSEAVGKRLLAEIEYPTEANLCLRKNGYGYLRAGMKRWCELSTQQPVILLTDLDQHACPQSLMNDWFGQLIRPTNLIFRIAVREVESWLLADHEAIRQLIGQKGKLPPAPDSLDDPKRHLLGLATKASRDIRQDLVNEIGAAASQGIGYNARLTDFVANFWSPERASERSPSLHRTRLRLNELGQRFAQENVA